MTNYFVGVTAYERPKRLMRLMTQLHQQRDVRTEIRVMYDAPEVPTMIEEAVGDKGTLHTPNEHKGRDEYWKLVNNLWSRAYANRDEWDYFLFVQDDVSIDDPALLKKVGDRLNVLEDLIPRIATLNLWGDGPDFERQARWTGRPVVETVHNVVFASWVDMVCAVFTPVAFSILPTLTPPVPRDKRAGESSGVGRWFSRSLDQACAAQLMVPEPWVEHDDGGTSKMHPDADRSNTSDANEITRLAPDAGLH